MPIHGMRPPSTNNSLGHFVEQKFPLAEDIFWGAFQTKNYLSKYVIDLLPIKAADPSL